MTAAHPSLSPAEQLDLLLDLGLDRLTDRPAAELRDHAAALTGPGSLVVHPALLPAAALATLLSRSGKAGFVVPDLTDLAEFVDVPGLDVPDVPLYLMLEPQRGDEMRNWSPAEAAPALAAAGRSPMTVNEAISWVLVEPERLEKNHCFMAIGSRKPRGQDSWDPRTPAVWISGGSAGDGGVVRRGAPKVGWCWWGNRHTWLGFGSVSGRAYSA